jgi:sRNA-binding protein
MPDCDEADNKVGGLTMKTRWLVTMVAAAFLLGGAPSLPAQESTGKATEEQMRQAERQLREQERQVKELGRQLREKERQMRDAAREYARLSGEQARQRAKVVWYGKRARLGVVLDPDPDAESAKTGARISAVTPGSAAEAGRVEGRRRDCHVRRPLAGRHRR